MYMPLGSVVYVYIFFPGIQERRATEDAIAIQGNIFSTAGQ